MTTIFSMAYRVRFSDCDPAGIVFYPQYFVMFNDLLEAWVDEILDGGFSGYVGKSRFGMPIVKLEADFVAVSKMGDDVQLELDVQRLGTKSISLEYRCVGQDDDLRMRVQQTLVTTSLDSHQSIEIPAALRSAIEHFLAPISGEQSGYLGSEA